MTTNQYQEDWLISAAGRLVDLDNDGSYDCPDVPKDYAEHIWANTTWRQVWPGAGNANDMINTVSTDYFDVIWNDPNNTAQIPERGDVVVFAGNGVNPYGHIAVVAEANTDGMYVLQEDSYLQTPITRYWLGYVNPGTGPVSGWLRPKFDSSIPPLQPYQRLTYQAARVRDGATTTNQIIKEYPADPTGTVFDFKAFVHGENVSGNDVWFVGKYSSPDSFIWSGIFEDSSTAGLDEYKPTPPPVPPVGPRLTGLNGFDCYSGNEGLSLLAVTADMVLLKATEGIGYADSELVKRVKDARASGKLVAFFHWAHIGEQPENTPQAEADYFISVIKTLVQPGDRLYLDWEEPRINLSRTDLAYDFLAYLRSKLPCVPGIYLNNTEINSFDWSKVEKEFILWRAFYPSSSEVNGYNFPQPRAMIQWEAGCDLEQYSSVGILGGYSGHLDLDFFIGTKDDWTAKGVKQTVTEPVKKKSDLLREALQVVADIVARVVDVP